MNYQSDLWFPPLIGRQNCESPSGRKPEYWDKYGDNMAHSSCYTWLLTYNEWKGELERGL